MYHPRKAYNYAHIFICYLLDAITNISNDESIWLVVAKSNELREYRESTHYNNLAESGKFSRRSLI